VTQIVDIDVLTASLPFRFSFGHALAERRESTNVFVRVRLDDGTVGHGEGVPREYVTGETVDSALEALCERQVPVVVGRALEQPDDVVALLDEVPGVAPDGSLDLAARCALELAVLDAAGKSFGLSVAHWLGGSHAPFVTYDAVLPFSSPRKVAALALVIRALGVRQVKAKVGGDLEKEARSLRALRRVLGSRADIRVDANCAWNAEQAISAIERLREFRLSAVEQPVLGDDLEGLRTVTAAVPEAIIVDESLRTIEEARTLAQTNRCDAFNIRVSKCGGLLNSAAIARVAAEAGLFCVVGAQVGESGILSAAGRHLAAQIAPRYVEGSGGRFLLKEDVTGENMVPGRRGRAPTPSGPGLGVDVQDETLERLGAVHRTFAPSAVKTV
jgi:L-alanine-DL-glutamate epimerase-like enolase superfamily enzyme